MTADDELAVHAVMFRYALTVDGRDWDGFAAQFIPDCVCDYGEPFGVLRGTAQVRSWVEYLHVNLEASMHRISNLLIVGFEDGAADLRSYVDALFTRDERRFHGAGTFETKVRRTDDGWRIAEHRFLGMWAEGDFAVLDVDWTPALMETSL